MRIAPLLALPVLLLAGCGPDNGGYDTAPPADAPAQTEVPATATWSSDFDLTGTEPFWGLQIRAAGLTLTRPDSPPLSAANPGPSSEGPTGVWTTSAFTVRLTPGECSDGMSDRRYPFVATVTMADRELKGCGGPPRDVSEVRP